MHFEGDTADCVGGYLAFLIMPLTYSIANGIMFGMLAWFGIKVCTGQIKKIHPIMYVVCAPVSYTHLIKEECSLELEAVMLNVNSGHNKELMEMSHTLWEYAEYTARVREYAEVMELEEAVERAIEECIQEGILKEFLEKNRAEAKNMSIFEYDQEKHIKQEREEAWEEGRKEGKKAGERDMLLKLAEKKLRKGKTIAEIAEELEESEKTIKEILDSRKG